MGGTAGAVVVLLIVTLFLVTVFTFACACAKMRKKRYYGQLQEHGAGRTKSHHNNYECSYNIILLDCKLSEIDIPDSEDNTLLNPAYGCRDEDPDVIYEHILGNIIVMCT